MKSRCEFTNPTWLTLCLKLTVPVGTIQMGPCLPGEYSLTVHAAFYWLLSYVVMMCQALVELEYMHWGG